MASQTITVTREDIDAAIHAKRAGRVPSETCPLAQACNRQLRLETGQYVGIGLSRINLWGPEGLISYAGVDEAGKKIIDAFDKERKDGTYIAVYALVPATIEIAWK